MASGVPWYETAFQETYDLVYAHRDDESADRESRFALRHLNLKTNDLVLDLGCGNGRHSISMKRLGVRVIGLDYSKILLSRARSRDDIRLIRGDMKAIPIVDQSFSAVTNFFTSFGYFIDPSDDLKTLTEIYRVLVPSGRFLLDFMNVDKVRKSLVPTSTRIVGDYQVSERRHINGDRVCKQVTVTKMGSCETIAAYEESVRLYDEQSLKKLLQRAGFEIISKFDSFEETKIAEAVRLIIVAQRK